MTNDQEQQAIKNNSRTHVNVCACDRCKMMCREAVCIGTPNDILKIAQEGFAARLDEVLWMAGNVVGLPPIMMIQPMYDENKGSCTFLSVDGLCELHHLNIKPTEGKLSDHNPKPPIGQPAYYVAMAWQKDYNLPAVEEIIKLMPPKK